VCAPGQNTIMFGWNAKTPGGETFGDIYRKQYRQQRARPGLRAAAGLALPLGGGFWLFGHRLAIAFIVFVVAVVLLVAAVVLGRRERRAASNNAHRRFADVVDDTSSADRPPPA
jgi:Flp pilus assembly protein TadB